jgi:hypothetical protein
LGSFRLCLRGFTGISTRNVSTAKETLVVLGIVLFMEPG